MIEILDRLPVLACTFDSVDVMTFLSCILPYHGTLSKIQNGLYIIIHPYGITQLFILYVYCIALLISFFIEKKLT